VVVFLDLHFALPMHDDGGGGRHYHGYIGPWLAGMQSKRRRHPPVLFGLVGHEQQVP
jgi:hypothetical protein